MGVLAKERPFIQRRFCVGSSAAGGVGCGVPVGLDAGVPDAI